VTAANRSPTVDITFTIGDLGKEVSWCENG